MIDTDFHDAVSTVPSPSSSSQAWDYLAASDTNLTFVAGTTQPIELSASSGVGFLANVDAPDRVHQMVEVRFVFGATVGSLARTGAFLLYQDANNYVAVYGDHNDRKLHLIEIVAGVEHDLATSSVVAANDVTGASVRLEIIGRRARWWFEPHFRPTEDQPPDDAVDLVNVYNAPGQWGIYMVSNIAGADMRIVHFVAKELPSAALPPPSLAVAAAANLDLKPVTATVSSVSSATELLEWEVMPADPDDFPESYHDLTIATVTTRVLWLRPGYTYDVRVRELKKNGGANPWTATQRIVVSGSKLAPSSFPLPNDEMPSDILPDYVMDRNHTAETVSTTTDDGREFVSVPFTRPQNGFKLVYSNREAPEIQALIDFFDRMTGARKPFKFVHPISGQQFAVHFVGDDYEFDVADMNSEADGAIGSIAFEIAEVVVGGTGTLTISLAVDPALL